MITVASFMYPQTAHVARGVLVSAGIPAVILDEHLVQANWMLSQAVGGVKVTVPERDIELARELLSKEFRGSGADTENLRIIGPDDRCPACGSVDITANRYSPLSLIPSILLQLPVFFRRKKWVCRSCGETW